VNWLRFDESWLSIPCLPPPASEILKAHQYPDNRDADTRDGWSSYHFYLRWPVRPFSS
jgi:hypothetical protein